MQSTRRIAGAHVVPFLALALAAVLLPVRGVHAQYFGRNKVQYQTFDFRVMHTAHYDVYFYPAESLAAADAARMAERWYARHSGTMRHTFTKKPIIFYANHPEFEQTNVVGGFINQGTGGVTEGMRDRATLPFTGVYADNDHVLGHELVHVFQYDIAGTAQGGGGMSGMERLPLWLIEGMAEYLSLGRYDVNTAMWLRDAAMRNDIPTIKKLNTDPRYFPYRYGQALWAYIGGRWGDQAVNDVYRASLRAGFEGALRRVLGVSSDTLSAQWIAAIKAMYQPLMAGRQKPGDVGQRLLERTSKYGDMDVSPTLSPDGRYVAFLTQRGLLSIDLYVADAQTGRIVHKLTGPNADPHFDALSFINSAGTWSPDGRKLAYVVTTEGHQEIAVFDVESGHVDRRLRVPEVGEITDPAWGPNNQIVFAGSHGGIGDLYLIDAMSGQWRRLTSDRYADLQPTWSPDGKTIAFASDRGPGGTDFDKLTYAPLRIAMLDVASGDIRILPPFENAKHINPQFSPDGKDLFFISDRGGFDDIYRYSLADNTTYQVTRMMTGVSGITDHSPALTVAARTGRMIFSVFEHGGNTLYRLEPDATRGEPTTAVADGKSAAGLLPPAEPRGDLVATYLADPNTGLPPAGTTFAVTPYHPGLQLDYLGTSGVGVAVGGGIRGAGLVGGVTGYFGDMLGDHVVGATIQAQGELRDIGGELFYLNQRRRLNWSVGVSHVPYLTGYVNEGLVNVGGAQGVEVDQVLQRIYIDQGSLMTQYPISQTRRFEASASATHVGYGIQLYRTLLDQYGDVVGQDQTSQQAPPGFVYYQSSLAFVGDYSSFGFTSPIAGARYRFEVSPTVGTVKYEGVLADYRRYFFFRPVTLAFRALHYGRYAENTATDSILGQLFVGQEYFIRGYDPNSFTGDECTGATVANSCPAFNRLIGSRIGVANLELRIPLFGTEQLGLINFPFLPTEISPFLDAGVAWTQQQSPSWTFARQSSERTPVFSAGLSARFNLFGYAVVEAYYAYPFQRPVKGAHFGFQLAPGW